VYIGPVLAAFDIRLPPTADQAEFDSIIQRWCTDAGPDVTYRFVDVSSHVLHYQLNSFSHRCFCCKPVNLEFAVFVTQNWVSTFSNVSWRHTFLQNI